MNIAFKQAHSATTAEPHAGRRISDIWCFTLRRTTAIPQKITRITSLGRRFRPQRTILWTKMRSGSRSTTRISHGTAHARTYFHPYCRNANSIGIELCSRKNGEKFYFMPETVRRAQALTCELMAKYGNSARKCCAPLRCYAQKLSCAVRRERIRVDSIQAGVTEKGGT